VIEHPNARVVFRDAHFSPVARNGKLVSFAGYHFPSGGTIFSGATFNQFDVSFQGAVFLGDVAFVETHFRGPKVDFRGTIFRDCEVLFEGAVFEGSLLFKPASKDEPTSISTLSFRRARFDSVLDLEGRFKCIPDLRSTITQGHVDLQKLVVEPWTPDRRSPAEQFSKDPDNDVPKLRRLKELAETNRHHDAALRFFADERRAMRWNKKQNGPHLGWAASIGEWTYDLLSRYGQSIGRPVVGMLATLVLFAFVYGAASTNQLPAGELIGRSVSASVSNTLPFIPAAFDIRRSALEGLFGTGNAIPLVIDLLRLVQGVLGFLFLFLIGLGLRNRFRM
jgi:hypothetical protein